MNLALHMRISGFEVRDEDVNSRRNAAGDLKAKWLKSVKVETIYKRAQEISIAIGSEDEPPPNLCAEVEAAVQVHASAFLASERQLEVGVCAAAAVLEIFDGSPGVDGWNIGDVLATALWSALAFQPSLENPKRENLRIEVLDAARNRAMNAAEEGRARSEVSEFGDFAIVTDDEAQTKASFKKATAATIKALRRNSALDREEIDFLWWTLAGRSRLLKRPFTKTPEATRLVAAGLEAASYLRRFPCDVHRDLVLRHAEDDAKLALQGLLTEIAGDREILIESFKEKTLITETPAVFPLLYALVTGDFEILGGSEERHSTDWGGRALLEASLLTNGPAQL